MSDIGLRFDGLILLIALAVGACAYLLIALVSLAVAIARARARAWRIAGFAGCLGVFTFAVTAGFAVYWDKHSLDFHGIDLVDQLTYLWVLVFLGGCWFLTRVR